MRKRYWSLVWIAIAACITACGDRDSTLNRAESEKDTLQVPETKDSLEDQVIASILELPEVVERGAFIDSMTNGKHHLTALITLNPQTGDDFYWVEVAEDNGEMLVTHFNFYYYPSTHEIKYLDVVNDRVLSLEEWRSDSTSLQGKFSEETRDVNY